LTFVIKIYIKEQKRFSLFIIITFRRNLDHLTHHWYGYYVATFTRDHRSDLIENECMQNKRQRRNKHITNSNAHKNLLQKSLTEEKKKKRIIYFEISLVDHSQLILVHLKMKEEKAYIRYCGFRCKTAAEARKLIWNT